MSLCSFHRLERQSGGNYRDSDTIKKRLCLGEDPEVRLFGRRASRKNQEETSLQSTILSGMSLWGLTRSWKRKKPRKILTSDFLTMNPRNLYTGRGGRRVAAPSPAISLADALLRIGRRCSGSPALRTPVNPGYFRTAFWSRD